MPDESIWDEMTPEERVQAVVEDPSLLQKPPAPPDLIRGSDLEEEPPEPAELGFEPGNLYKGFSIIPDREPRDERHAYLFDPDLAPGGSVRAFYVVAPDRSIGLVPWAGSTVIWPWEKAWEQDLYHAQQTPEKIAFRKEYAKRMKAKEK